MSAINATVAASWQDAFHERHEFDVYPDHFMAGMRNEFSAGWYAALKSAANAPRVDAVQELKNFVDAKRFNRAHFEDDTAFVDWMLSRACAALGA